MYKGDGLRLFDMDEWFRRFGFGYFLLFLLVFFVFFSFVSSVSRVDYRVGDMVSFVSRDDGGFLSVRVKAPFGEEEFDVSGDSFDYSLNQSGEYVFFLREAGGRVRRESHDVLSPVEKSESLTDSCSSCDGSLKDFSHSSYEGVDMIRVGEPVLNEKTVYLDGGSARFKVHSSARNVSLDSAGDSYFKKGIFQGFFGILSTSDEKDLVVEGDKDVINVSYYTSAPKKEERRLNELEKEVVISSEKGLDYSNVLASTNIDEIVGVEGVRQIRVYWVEEDRYLPFDVIDSDGDGLVDEVEWVVPHLSTQTFKIILIRSASHLDSERNFIRDVYPLVKEKDDEWALIPSGDFVRVSFEENLTSENDITLYAKSEDGFSSVDIYEEGSEDIVATISRINKEGFYKVFLSGLESEKQDSFDLRFMGGTFIDLIIDPSSIGNCVGVISCIDNGGEVTCDCSSVDSSDNVYLGAGLSTKSANLAQGRINFSNSSLVPSSATITSAELIVEMYVSSGMSSCNISYSTDSGSDWNVLDSDCTDETSERVRTFDLSSLSESELENFWLDITAVKISNKGAPLTLGIDHTFLNVSYAVQGDLSVSLSSPEDEFYSNTTTNSFSYVPSSTATLLNCSFYDNSSSSFSHVSSNSSVVVDGTNNSFSITHSTDGGYEWNVFCCDDSNGCAFAPLNRSIIIDTTGPLVSSVAPPNESNTGSLYGVDFVFNVTDSNPIDRCSLYIDGNVVENDFSITKGVNQTITYPVSSGVHEWYIGCVDSAGNLGTSESREINVSFSPQTYDARWYETSTSDYTDSADIYLSNTRDATANSISYSIPGSTLFTAVEAVSPFMVNNGALIGSGEVSFSGDFSASRNNQLYVTWKVYVTNTGGDSLICQYGDDSTSGARISSSGTFTGSCTNLNDLYLSSTDRLKLVVNVWNDLGSPVDMTHSWDDLYLSFVEFSSFSSLGDVSVDMLSPSAPRTITTGEGMNVSCLVNCSAGECKNTDVYVQYNTSSSSWVDVGSSGNLVLSSGETNPHNMLDVTTSSNVTNFTIQGNLASVNNLRCVARSDYSNANSSHEEVIVVGANQDPFVELISPENNSWTDSNDVVFSYNASDDGEIDECALYIDGALNQTNQAAVVEGEINNFSVSGLEDGSYYWNVACNDTTGRSNVSENFTLNVDSVFPSLELVFPYDDEVVETNIVEFLFNVSDNLDLNISCNLTLDGVLRDSPFNVTNDSQGNVGLSGLSVGEHLWNVSCSDEAGNTNLSSTWNFSVVDSPPEINLGSPENNSWLDSGDVVFFYNASDNNELTQCSLYINGSLNQTNQSVLVNGGENNFSVSGFSDSSYEYYVNCSDNAGLNSLSESYYFFVDSQSPIVSLNLLSDYINISYSDVYFNYTVTDRMDSVLSCNLTYDGVEEIIDYSAQNGSLEEHFLTALPDGLSLWNVSCVDEAGNLGVSSDYRLNITDFPTVDLLIDDGFSFNTSLVNLSYLPDDNMGVSGCDLYLDGVFNRSNQSEVIEGVSNDFSLELGPGYYNWSVVCTDDYGLLNRSEWRNFSVDLFAPKLDLYSPYDSQTLYSNVVAFNYSVSDDLDDEIQCDLTVDSVIVNSSLAQNGSVSYFYQRFSSGGLKYWNITCYDDAGNLNLSETRNFTLYLPPVVDLIEPENQSWTNEENIFFYYNVSDGNDDLKNSTLVIDGEVNQTNSSVLVNNDLNNFSVSGLSEGEHNWTVKVYDSEELLGTFDAVSFYVDRTSPKIEINHPYQDEVVDTNNVSFNFTIDDELSNNFTCNISVDDYNEFEEETFFNGTNLRYTLRNDGNYSYYVSCQDQAGNGNYTADVNFSVVAPPNVTLNSPFEGYRSTSSSLDFNYTPYDAIGIVKCDFYFDGENVDNDSDIEANEANFFSYSGISEGEHNWTVSCNDSDFNTYTPEAVSFVRDISPPKVELLGPENDSGIDYNNDNVFFEWVANDSFDDILYCNITVSGDVLKEDIMVSDEISRRESISRESMGEGEHYWNVSCADDLGNTNTSVTYFFNYTLPDFEVNNSLLSLNQSSLKEDENVLISSEIYNHEGCDSEGVTVSFYDGDPEEGGSLIDSDVVDISRFNSTNVSVVWSAAMGSHDIYVVVDPPVLTNGSLNETNEENNEANKSVTIGSWYTFYGDLNSGSRFILNDETNDSLVSWKSGEFDYGNVYVTDYEADISWLDMVPIGINASGSQVSGDFFEVDEGLSMVGFNDSVNRTFTKDGSPRSVRTFEVFGQSIDNVAVINSTNNSNFVTGLLWDKSDDLDGEYDSGDKEDLVFIANLNKDSQGAYGVYDYEVRVPARLREYDSTDSVSALYYVEIN